MRWFTRFRLKWTVLSVVVLGVVAGTLGITSLPAQASSPACCVQTIVPVGATYRTQFLRQVIDQFDNSCDTSRGIYVSWTMDVQNGGIYVDNIKVEFYNNDYVNDTYIGHKWLYGDPSVVKD